MVSPFDATNSGFANKMLLKGNTILVFAVLFRQYTSSIAEIVLTKRGKAL